MCVKSQYKFQGVAMNLQKLHEAEAAFLARFPGGFADPGLARIRKSHNVDALAKFTRENLTAVTLDQPSRFAELAVTIVSRSSMVSRFEKPAFKAFVNSLTSVEKRALAAAFRDRLLGRKREGFEQIVELFARYKLARWSLVSAIPFYFSPRKEAFVKPTTAKRIVAALEVERLQYRPRPDWRFYEGYRKLIAAVNARIDPSITPSNAATTGFLMSMLR